MIFGERMITMILPWFPTPYPDELLYSVLARYHVRSGNTSYKITTEELFGTRTVRSVWDLPANTKLLISNIGPYMTKDMLLFQHTMYPYYAHFLKPEQEKKVRESMYEQKGGTIHTRSGVAASNVKVKTHLWVCSECIDSDMNSYGETYWRRVHQAPGVYICPHHGNILEETIIAVKEHNQHEFVAASSTVERTPYNLSGFSDQDIKQLQQVACYTDWLLQNKDFQKLSNTVRNYYMELLKRRGLTSVNGRVKRDQLYHSFQSSFSPRLLNLLQSPISLTESDWLTQIFQKHRKSFHPIRHILIMLFLETNPAEYKKVGEYHPFGEAPYYCLNPVCPAYRQRVIQHVEITPCYNTRKPVGTFQCDCGFIYSRRGPDQSIEDAFRIGRIKEYGSVWKKRLEKLVIEGKRLYEIKVELQCDVATVKKYAEEMQLKVSWKRSEQSNKKVSANVNSLATVDHRRKKWLEVKDQFPNKTKTELRKIVLDVYTYLYRHDRLWLNEHSPLIKRQPPPNYRVNWEQRDEEICRKIATELKTWDQGAKKLTRITATAIGKKIRKVALLENYKNKLPKAMRLISESEESLEDFQKRRVLFVMEQMQKEGMPIIQWRVYKKAGLTSEVSDEVKRFITLKLTEYESVSKFKN